MIELEKFTDFMLEYSRFFEEMAMAQKKKLSILLSNDLKAIEEDILIQQALAKRLDNYERKRMVLLDKLGCSNEPFKSVILKVDSKSQEILRNCMNDMEASLSDIQYYNQKSMEILKMNAALLDIRNQSPKTYDASSGRQVHR
jgi:hypothetical protein